MAAPGPIRGRGVRLGGRVGGEGLQAAISKLALWWLERGRRRKRFTGSIFDRLTGLDPVLAECRGATVLDIGCCDGLVAYELARHGATTVHGFELDAADVLFARRLFRDVPGESVFTPANLATSEPFGERFGAVLLDRYDVVLFLGVHHHFERQMSAEDLRALVGDLLARTSSLFAVRTKRVDALEPQVLAAGFERIHEHLGPDGIGPLRIYRRAGGA